MTDQRLDIKERILQKNYKETRNTKPTYWLLKLFKY